MNKRHISIAKRDTIEFIGETQISPLITKGVAKVLYVGDNRNGTSISEEVALEMGKKLPGSPVVGYYREDLKDFEEHSREIKITTDKFEVLDLTKPYGFVPTDSKIWFQTFVDDGVEHKYLCCEVYIWTSAYPETQRIFDHGNNQSMELDEKSIQGNWADAGNSKHQIFIINEALIEKLCILGEDFEPCFEGASVQAEFSLQLDEEFKQLRTSMFSMMNEVQNTLNKGGAKMKFTVCDVKIGDALWSAIYSYLRATFPSEKDDFHSTYAIRGIYEDEDNTQKFALIQNCEDDKIYRMNFVWSDSLLVVDSNTEEAEGMDSYSFSVEDNENYKKKEEEEDNSGKEDNPNSENKSEGKKDNDEDDDDEDDDNKKDKKYSLEEIPEYTALLDKYSDLESKYQNLENEINALREFKLERERIDKRQLIDQFFMLSDKDKEDVNANIDNYSLADIEAKLSVLCFRNKVSFADPSTEEDDEGKPGMTFSLNGLSDNDSVPEWVKIVRLAQTKE